MNKGHAIFVLALILGACACSDSMSPDAYSHTWREAVAKYRAIDKHVSGMVDGDATTPEQLSDQAQEIARQIREIGVSIHDLKEPEQFKTLQEETYIFYRGQADAYQGYAEALGTADPNKIATTADGINSFAGGQQQKIMKIIEGLGVSGDAFKTAWAQVLQDAPAKKS